MTAKRLRRKLPSATQAVENEVALVGAVSMRNVMRSVHSGKSYADGICTNRAQCQQKS